MNTPRNPLITGITNDAGERGANMLPTSYAINQLFSGKLLENNKDINTVLQCGTYRFQESTNNTDTHMPSHLRNAKGILTVMHERIAFQTKSFGAPTPTASIAATIRQIVWPDGPNDITPYTRTKVNGVWSEWVTLGGNMRRVKLDSNITAQTNVMYYSFGNHTLTLPDPSTYPLSTRIGLEQWLGRGTVRWVNGSTTYTQTTDPAYQADSTGAATTTVIGPNVYYFEIVEDTASGTRAWMLDVDNDLSNTITDIRANISSEALTRAAADTALEQKVNSTLGVNIASPYSDTTISQRITNEATTRASEDTTLRNRIATEETTRATADTTLEQKVNSTLGINISTYTGTTVNQLITNERTARVTADTNLENTINNKNRLTKTYYVNTNIATTTTFTDGNGISQTVTNLLKVVNPIFVLGSGASTVALPAASATYNGAKATIEITAAKTVTVTAGTDSESFTNDTGATLVLPFECVMTGTSSYAWNLLVIA